MPKKPIEVLIAGGGVAGLETLLALDALAGDRVRVTMLAPEPDFVYRALGVAEPFSLGHATRYPLWRIAHEKGARLVADGLAEVRPDSKQVVCTSGTTLDYDVLVLAIGTVATPVQHALTFTGQETRASMGGLLADLEQGYCKRVAFVAPTAGWTLPLYELAIMTAREVWAQGIDDVGFWLVTPEETPLALFGAAAAATVGELLSTEGIVFVGSTYGDVQPGAVVLDPRPERLEVDRIVSLPRLRGPAVAGVPADAEGFIAVDGHGRVLGMEAVYAAGDATTFPVKQGGLAAQQADAVAASIAERAGALVDAEPFHPVLRGMLLTGGADRYLVRGTVTEARAGTGEASESPLWWPPTKISGRYLSPYLLGRDEAEVLERARWAQHVAVDVEVPGTPVSVAIGS